MQSEVFLSQTFCTYF